MKCFIHKAGLLAMFAIGFILCSGKIYAQDYLIHNSGEKEPGLVVRNFDYNRYQKVKFEHQNGQTKIYTPEEVSGFMLDNGRYFRTESLPNEILKQFAQILFTGELDLLAFEDKYFLKVADEIRELGATFTSEVVNENLIQYRKPYISTLNSSLSGDCAVKLQNEILKTKFSETSLISTLILYHECKMLDYSVHVDKIPLLQVSAIVAAGYIRQFTKPTATLTDRSDLFATNAFTAVQVGVRIHSYRKFPKAMVDIGLGYSVQNNSISSQWNEERTYVTGTEDFESYSWYIPVYFNYSFINTLNYNVYFGVGATYRKSYLTSNFSMVDETVKFNNTTNLFERPIVQRDDEIVSPNIKMGAMLFNTRKVGVVFEVQAEYLPDHFSFNLGQHQQQYNQFYLSALVGIRIL